MRIKSPFKDYYDKAQRFVYGEGSFIFNRKAARVVLPVEYQDQDQDQGKGPYSSYYTKTKIGFCGNIYGCISCDIFEYDYWKWLGRGDRPTERITFYSAEEYLDFRYKGFLGNRRKEEKRNLTSWFTTKQDDGAFIANECPVFISRYNGTIIHTYSKNAGGEADPYTLEGFDFHKVKSFEIAFQEIESYISGVLTREHKNIPNMSNVDKISLHGFDEQSFRG